MGVLMRLAVSAAVVAMAVVGSQALAQTSPLSGRVSSAAEGATEGVLVSAQKAGSTITVTVVTDAQGRYAFPTSKLSPGTYALRTRAVGYELEGPAAVQIPPGQGAVMVLRLTKTADRVARLDFKTDKFTEYLLPRSTNIRRVFVDNSTTPVTFWVGNNHGASVVRLEPAE